MPGDILDHGFCRHSLSYYPIDTLIPGMPNDIGILMVITGISNVLMSLVTVIWIKTNEYEAQAEDGREEAAKSVIFPIFVNVLWLSIAANLFTGIIVSVVPIDPGGGNDVLPSLMYAIMVAIRHAIIEGIAFLLMQKGCGRHAAGKAGTYAFVWGICTFGVMYYVYISVGIFSSVLEVLWDLALLTFYVTLIVAPQESVFRRPAAIFYSKFWAIYALINTMINLLFLSPQTRSLGSCAYVFANVLLSAILSPLICYWTLLQDSRWWQGLEIERGTDSTDNARVPLLGSDLSLSTAQSLAATMDVMRNQRVKMLNFACIKFDFNRHLGAGSFSKVYRGTYRGSECAIKLIYTMDLTIDVIQRVAAEASILSSIQHPNIVHIYGVSVLPPSVCLILEICSFGSLSDVIRGYGFDWSSAAKHPLTANRTDMLYLALGCARGLAAVHALSSSICHRDVKSFNFLVDRMFTVKIADLELGMTQRSSALNPMHSIEADPAYVNVEERLANWLAPEVITERRFQQASDVFSLGTVLWEIFAKRLPFDRETQAAIREKLVSGFQHPMPAEEEGSPMALLIQNCWQLLPSRRPTAAEVALAIESMLTNCCSDLVAKVNCIPNIAAVKDFYEGRYRRIEERQSVFRMSYRNASRTSHSSARKPGNGSWWNPLRYLPSHYSEDYEMGLGRESETFLRAGYALPKVGTADLLGAVRKYGLAEQVPLEVQQAIGQIKTERYWQALESTSEAWAAVSLEPPHIILHATSRWFAMFNACSSFGQDHHLWSLLAMLHGDDAKLLDAHCTASNSHTLAAGQTAGGFKALQKVCGNEVLARLRTNQQVHGIMCFQLLDPSPRSQASHASHGSRAMSLKSFSTSETTSRLNGHNMMCSVHAYPVFPSAATPLAPLASTNSDSPAGSPPLTAPLHSAATATTVAGSPIPLELKLPTDTINQDKDSRMSDESKSSPMGEISPGPSPSRIKSVGSQKPRGSSLFSRGSLSAKKAAPEAAAKPLYFLMQFNELLELNSEQPQVQTRRGSTSVSHYSHSQRSHRSRWESEEAEEEQGYSFLGMDLGRFWTSSGNANRQQSTASQYSQASEDSHVRYHSMG